MGYVEELRALIGHKRINLNGSVVILQNAKGQILMQQRAYSHRNWALPGGIMELGESTEETARREVMEETGLKLGELSLFGVYSGENYLCIAQNGDEFYCVTTVYTASEYYGEVSLNDHESLKFEWIDLNELPENTAKSHKEMINDYIRSK